MPEEVIFLIKGSFSDHFFIGNFEIMARGTFGNIRIINKLVDKVGPQTLYVPSGQVMDIFDAAEKYVNEGHSIIVLAGQEYGSGSSGDWAAK